MSASAIARPSVVTGLLFLFAIFSFPHLVRAADTVPLTAAEIEKLLIGNTIEAVGHEFPQKKEAWKDDSGAVPTTAWYAAYHDTKRVQFSKNKYPATAWWGEPKNRMTGRWWTVTERDVAYIQVEWDDKGWTGGKYLMFGYVDSGDGKEYYGVKKVGEPWDGYVPADRITIKPGNALDKIVPLAKGTTDPGTPKQ
jgi:hypothetical protein